MPADLPDIRRQVLDALHAVAPETAARAIPEDRPLRDVIDLDSMDWLNVLAGVEQRAGIEIPPADQASLRTLQALVAYIAALPEGARAGAGPAGTALPCRRYIVQGLPVLVRPMGPQDIELEAEFVQRLSATSRYKRFMATLNELPEAQLKALTDVDQVRQVALVAVVLVDGAPALAGVARYAIDDAGTGCEFALAVDDAWQGSGLAGILMRLLMETARSRGLATMEGLVLRSNDRMLKLGRQLGFERSSDPADRETVRIVRALQGVPPGRGGGVGSSA